MAFETTVLVETTRKVSADTKEKRSKTESWDITPSQGLGQENEEEPVKEAEKEQQMR